MASFWVAPEMSKPAILVAAPVRVRLLLAAIEPVPVSARVVPPAALPEASTRVGPL